MCNAVGMMLGVGTILWLGPTMGVMASAIGYMVACFISALAPMIVVWVHDRMRWGGLLTRIVVGYVLILGCLFLGLRHSELWVSVVLTVAFCAVWALISWGDLAPRIRMVTGRFRKN